MNPSPRGGRSHHPLVGGALLALILLACHPTMRPGEIRIVRHDGDPTLRTEAAAGVFVGASHVCADEAEARKDAELQARQAIMASLQTQIESEVLQQVRLDGSVAEILAPSVEQTAQIRALSRNVIRVQPEAWYVEVRERAEGGAVRTEVQAWCRMRYSTAQHEALLEDLLESMGPLLDERLSRLEAAREAGLGETLRLAASARSQLAALDRYQGWTPSQQGRLAAFRQRLDDARGRVVVWLQTDCRVDGQSRTSGFGSALARARRDQLGVDVREGAPSADRRNDAVDGPGARAAPSGFERGRRDG